MKVNGKQKVAYIIIYDQSCCITCANINHNVVFTVQIKMMAYYVNQGDIFFICTVVLFIHVDIASVFIPVKLQYFFTVHVLQKKHNTLSA
jgi:hypothetical protein